MLRRAVLVVLGLCLAVSGCAGGKAGSVGTPGSEASATPAPLQELQLATGVHVLLPGKPTGTVGGRVLVDIDENHDQWQMVDAAGDQRADPVVAAGLTAVLPRPDRWGAAAFVTGTRTGTGLAGPVEVLARLNADGTTVWTVPIKTDSLPLARSDVSVITTPNGDLSGIDGTTGKALWTLNDASWGANFVRGGRLVLTGNHGYATAELRSGQILQRTGQDPLSARSGPRLDEGSGDAWDKYRFFENGDVLALALGIAPNEYRGDGVQRIGAHPWHQRGVFLAASETRVLIAGPSGDLVLVDAATGAPIGKPVVTANTDIARCADDPASGIILSDTVVGLKCPQGGALVGIA